VDKKPVNPGKLVLDVKDVYAENDKGLPALRGLSLNVREGEIVGVAGVAGNGQNELSQVITGCGRQWGTNDERRYGHHRHCSARHVSAPGLHVSVAPNLSITDNVIMKNYRKAPISNRGMLDMPAANKFADELKKAYDIIVPSVNTPVRLLSGGNLQRVILAREISGHPNFMVAVQPTRGLDVGAIEGVHRLLLTQREAGAAVLLVWSDTR
jgi:simple sugar transport system ATP-binding protein